MARRELTVGYSRKLSDGNFGSEEVSASLTEPLEPGQDAEELLCELAGQAADFVYGRLAHSRSAAVRAAVETRDERLARIARRPRVDEVDGEEDVIQGVG